MSSRRAVAVTVHHSEESSPGPDVPTVLMRHDSCDLMQMIHVVRYPGGEQLGERDPAERWMPPAPHEIPGCEIHRAQLAETLRSCGRKFIEQLTE